MKKHELKMAGWARAELRRKAWKEWRVRFFQHVRGTFILLLFMTIIVFVFNHHVETQIIAFEKIHHAVNVLPLSSVSDRLRQNAINYEKQVDDAAK